MSALELRRPLRLAALGILALALVMQGVFAGEADARKKKKRSTLPSVTSIAPKQLSIGDTLVIKGKRFIKDKRHTVIFRKVGGGRYYFAPSLTASSRRLTVKVPSRIGNDFDTKNGAKVPTKFQIRVIAKRASSKFVASSKAPTILPPPDGSKTSDCDSDGQVDAIDIDDDNDGLSDAIELAMGLNICNVDSDGDGAWDSYEYEVALDLNSRALPSPSKKPWANPLDGSDAGADFDGDGLTLSQEHKLWQAAGRPYPLNYSDGQQYTGGPIAAPEPADDVWGYDIDHFLPGGRDPNVKSLRSGVGYLSDDERDFDNDGLSNIQEFSLRLSQGYWSALSEKIGEKEYPVRPFSDLDPTLADTDGDGLIDGLDDQDMDGWSNRQELYREAWTATSGHAYMTQPFNPCLPDWQSPTCSRYQPAGDEPWSPFNLPGLPVAPISWNDSGPLDSETPGFVPPAP